MLKIVISGSHGFLGESLVEKLQSENHEVIRYKFGDPIPLKFDYFFHLSSYGNHYSQKDPLKTVDVNYSHLFVLLEQLQMCKFKGFFNFSTSSVSLAKQTLYSATKMGGEYLCRAYADKLPIVSIRPSSVYGPQESDQRFIPTVIRCLLTDEEFNLDSYATHTWIYIEDFINALLSLIENKISFKGQAINIASEDFVNNYRIVVTLEAIAKKKAKFKEIAKMRNYDNKHWKVKSTIPTKWRAKIDLERGLRLTYGFYYNRYRQA